MLPLTPLHSPQAPQPAGPYSTALQAGPWLFCSGQIGIDPTTNELKPDIASQTEQALANLLAILQAGQTDFSRVVRCDLFLKDMNDFSTVNEIYAHHFSVTPQPTRVTVAVAELPRQALIEIACLAFTE